MKRNIRLYIDDIMRNMNKILQYTEGMEESSFCADEKTTDAVIRCIEIIGETVKNSRDSPKHLSEDSLEANGRNAR
jgi:uncharacterized protein with HEPN domain